jgi:hypothetical protein
MPHLKCICFVSPSEDSLDAIRRELREPKYSEYYLCAFRRNVAIIAVYIRQTTG